MAESHETSGESKEPSGTPSDTAAPEAPSRAPSGAASATVSGLAADWPRKAADAVDLVVGTVNDKAVRPVLIAARAAVFGLLVAVMATVVLVMGAIALVRLLDVYAFPGRVWASYALIGVVVTVAGLFSWSKRYARPVADGAGPR